MCVALAGLCASAQQPGEMAVGVNLGVAPCLESGADLTNFGIGAKFQYNLTAPIRLEAGINYGFKDKGMSVLDIAANAHYIFKVADKINVYPLVGIGYARITADYVDYDYDYQSGEMYESSDSESTNKLLVNVGAGAEYAINDKLSVGAEIKYQYIKDFARLPISIGVTYKF